MKKEIIYLVSLVIVFVNNPIVIVIIASLQHNTHVITIAVEEFCQQWL